MTGNYERMNRMVHAGLRRDVARMELVAQQPLAPERRAALARRIGWLVDFLHHHHTSEDEAIWPVAMRKQPQLSGLIEAMEAEHGAMAAAAHRLRDAAEAHARDGSESSRHALVDAVEALRNTCLPHLEHEETIAVPQLVQALDDRDWAQVDKRFRRGVGVKDLGWIAMWLLDDLDPADVQFLRRQLPGAVLTLLTWRWGRSYDLEASLAWGDLAGVRSHTSKAG
jgi:hemerythrin-like domain-containing protein